MKRFLLLLSVFALGLASCTKEPEGMINPEKKPDGEKLTETFSVKLSTGTVDKNELQTKSSMGVHDLDENKVNNLTLLFFSPSNDGSGKFLGYHKVDMGSVTSEELSEDEQNKGVYKFKLEVAFDAESGLSQAAGYSFLAMANVLDGNYFANQDEMNVFLSDLLQSKPTEAELKSSMIKHVAGQATPSSAAADAKLVKNNLPMTGSGLKTADGKEAQLNLMRAIARFDVQSVSSDYSLVDAYIYNAFSYPSLFYVADANYDQAHTACYYGAQAESNLITSKLYTPINNVSKPAMGDQKTTCLIVGLKKGADAVKYFRININPENVGQYIKRNHIYKVLISRVLGDGFATLDEAYKSDIAPELDYAINTWDRDEDGIIITNGDNMLALPTSKAAFAETAETREYSIFTSGTSKQELTMYLVNDDGSKTEATIDGTGEAKTQTIQVCDGIMAVLKKSMLTITTTAFLDDMRGGKLRFAFAGLEADMEVIQDGTAKKSLKLSHNVIPNYSAAGGEISYDPITVSTSGKTDEASGKVGAWTAQILLEEQFSFSNDPENPVYTHTGFDGDQIPTVYCVAPNGSNDVINDYVLVTLDEDPENHREVVVLAQNNSGKFTLIPQVNFLQFQADGEVYAEQENEFSVYSGVETDNWTVTIAADAAAKATDADKFKIVDKLGADQGQSYTVSGASAFDFKVVPVGANIIGEFKAKLQITQNGANSKEITLIQSASSLDVSPMNPTASAKGEKVKIKVAFAGETKLMKVSLTGTIDAPGMPTDAYHTVVWNPTFADGSKELNAPVGDFEVIVPPILPPYGSYVTANPEIKLSIVVAGSPSLESEIVIKQELPALKGFAVQNSDEAFSDFSNGDSFAYWKTIMNDKGLFGPSGIVRVPEAITGYDVSSLAILVNTKVVNITDKWMNGPSVQRWKTSDDIVFMLTNYKAEKSLKDNMPAGYTLTTGTAGRGNLEVRLNSAPTASRETKLWEYLVGGKGPFGAVNVNNVIMMTDKYYTVITKWPSTFIPLIMDGSGRCQFGIDPTIRFVPITNADIFHTEVPGNYPSNADNLAFARNVVAWVTHVALYGDGFTNQFKVK